MPSITQLQYILAVAELGHFGKAAEARHVSQPTLSGQIARAEDELGVQLFIRGTKPVELTDKGRTLLPEIEAVVASHERLLRLASHDLQTIAGKLTVGVIPTLAPYVLPWWVGALVERYPEVQLAIVERPTESLIDGLKNRHVDVALLAGPLDEDELEERVLFRDPFHLYAHPEHPLARCEAPIRPEQLRADEPWLLEDGHCLRHQALSICGRSHSSGPLGVRFEAASLETLSYLIDASGGYTLIPETFAQRLPKERRLERVRPLEDPVPCREVALAFPRASWKRELVSALEEVVRGHIPKAILAADPGAEVVAPR